MQPLASISKFIWANHHTNILFLKGKTLLNVKGLGNASIFAQGFWTRPAVFGRYRPNTLKNGYLDQKWPNIDHFWPFWGSSKSLGDTTSWKNKNKISNGQGCRTGTHRRTHRRERIYRFLPESKDIQGTNKLSWYERFLNTKSPVFTECQNSIPSSRYLRLSMAGYGGNRAFSDIKWKLGVLHDINHRDTWKTIKNQV